MVFPAGLAAEKVRLLRTMQEEMQALRGCLEKLATPSAGQFPEKGHFAGNPSDAGPPDAAPPEASPPNGKGDAFSRLPAHIARIDEIRKQIDELDRQAKIRRATARFRGATPLEAPGAPVRKPEYPPERLDSPHPSGGELPGAAGSGEESAAGTPPDEIPAELLALLRQIEELHRDNLRLAEKARRRWAESWQEFRAARRATAYLKHFQNNSAPGGWFVDRRR